MAAQVAAAHANDVDADARFPAEAFDAIRAHGLLGLLVPARFGGPGTTLDQVASICCTLAQACGSTALLYAMHQIQVACLVAAVGDGRWQAEFLARIAADQLLLASATSEAETGGDIRTSVCALQVEGAHFTLAKRAPTISYGEEADAILVTARRANASHASDQCLVVVPREHLRLVETGRWDTLGMRGTCSRGFTLEAWGHVGQILAPSFAEIAERTMLPVSHVLWGAVWLGIATDAVSRARALLRSKAQGAPGSVPTGSLRLQQATSLLRTMQTRLRAALADHASEAGAERSLASAAEINSLKITLSELAVQAVGHAMQACGIAGYRNGTPHSLGRHLRDIQSAPLMVNNDRIATNTAALVLAQRPASLVL